jgi:hypothetical protein
MTRQIKEAMNTRDGRKKLKSNEGRRKITKNNVVKLGTDKNTSKPQTQTKVERYRQKQMRIERDEVTNTQRTKYGTKQEQ